MSDDDLDEVLAQLWDTHSPTALERLALVRRAVQSLAEGEAPDDEAIDAAHNLAGSLGMFGFGTASKVTQRAEVALRAGVGGGDEELDELQRDLDGVAEQVAAGRRDPK